MTKKTVDVVTEMGNVLELNHVDPLRQMLATMLASVMGAEVDALCGAEYAERSDERVNHRNGYRPRALETRMGSIELAIPKVRHGSYMPSFVDPRRRWEKAFGTDTDNWPHLRGK